MSVYEEYWDLYVRKFFPESVEAKRHDWPGDEWGGDTSAAESEATFKKLFFPGEVVTWRNAFELGPGAGKYTRRVFETNPAVRILAFDVSSAFLEILAARLRTEIDAGRLELEHLRGETPDEMLVAAERRSLVRGVDAVYSIDAMVHVDLQYLVAYLLTAALVLRQGGSLLLTLPDATTDDGFYHLLQGIGLFYPRQGQPSGKFEWLSRSLVANLLPRLGFETVVLEPTASGRDFLVVARLVRPHEAELFRCALLRDTVSRIEIPSDADPPLLLWNPHLGFPCRFELSTDGFTSVPFATTELSSSYFRLPGEIWRTAATGKPYDWRAVATRGDPGRIIARGVIVKVPRAALTEPGPALPYGSSSS